MEETRTKFPMEIIGGAIGGLVGAVLGAVISGAISKTAVGREVVELSVGIMTTVYI